MPTHLKTDSDYHLEFNGTALCYRGLPIGGVRLLEHIRRMEERIKKQKAELAAFREAGDAMDNAISEFDPQRYEKTKVMQMTNAEYVAVMKWRTAKNPDYNKA